MICVPNSVPRFAQAALAAGLLLGLLCSPVRAADGAFSVESIATELVDGVYRLNTDIEYALSDVLLDALANGIELVLEVDVEIVRERAWWFSEDIASISLRHQLAYYPLSRMYVVRSLNTGVQSTFPSLYSALHAVGHLRSFPLLDASLLDPAETYQARLRARVLPEELPLPLRARAYIDSQWRPSSDWYTWSLP